MATDVGDRTLLSALVRVLRAKGVIDDCDIARMRSDVEQQAQWALDGDYPGDERELRGALAFLDRQLTH